MFSRFPRRLAVLLVGSRLAWAADVPVPCAAGTCGAGNPEVFVTAGAARYSVDGNVGTVEQLTDRAILNWQEFNLAAGARVVFRQPRDISVALNRIFQQTPSEVLGAIDANGQIYLINPNGFIFGENARVNTNTLLASSLNITDQVFNETGLINAVNAGNGIAALTAFEDGDGEILIEHGAQLTTEDGGQILLFAPKIRNEGTLKTPGGQTILGAASQQVYLQFDAGSDIRGLLVEVRGDVTDSVENIGEIIAERGNITLAGILLQQQGVLRATTDIDESGSIRLQARDGVTVEQSTTGSRILPERAGTLVMGENSVTEVLPDIASSAKAIDSQPEAVPRVELMGKEIRFERGASVVVPGGEVRVTATERPAAPIVEVARNAASLTIADGVRIDVSGTESTVLPMSRNQVDLDLRSNELADSPLQRDGVVRGETVSVDIRKGSTFANVDDAIANTGRTVDERLASGGDIVLESEGSISVATGAMLDVAGGKVTFEGGVLNTTQLITADGSVIDISEADPDEKIVGVFSGATKRHDAWGVTETFVDSSGTANARYEAGYVEGKDAGSVTLTANALDFAGQIDGGVVVGPNQRQPTGAIEGLRVARPFEQIPDGARFEMDLTQGREAVNAAIGASDRAETEIDSGLLVDSGIRTARILTLGAFDLGPEVHFVLPGGFSLEAQATDVLFGGSFQSQGGSLSLSSSIFGGIDEGNIRFGEGSRVDVSGLWINDFGIRGNAPLDPVWIDGGRISIAAKGDLIMAASASLSVNGGAWLQADGSLEAGRSGAISLVGGSTPERESKFIPTVQMSGLALQHGGSLTLQANALALLQRDIVNPVLGPDAGEDDFPILLPFEDLDFIPKVDAFIPSFLLRTNGFENVSIGANRYGVVVAGGSSIRPRQINYGLPASYQTQASNQPLSRFAFVQLLPEYERAPANLTLRYASSRGASFDPESGIVMLPGSSLVVDPTGTIDLETTGSIWLDSAALHAPAGNIELHIAAPTGTTGFNPSQNIRLASNSVLDVHGTFIARPTEFGLRDGALLNGGEIAIDAERGYVISEPTVRYDVGGTAALLDITRTDPDVLTPTWLASDAGSLSIRTAEGGLIGGTFNALNDRAASRDDGRGGRFELTIDANDRKVPEENPFFDPASQFSAVERVLAIVDEIVPPVFEYGDPIPNTLQGRVELAPDRIDQSGFDSLVLRAVNVPALPGSTQPADGRIVFEADTDLSMARSLEVYAPILAAEGDSVAKLSASYTALGYDRPAFFDTVAPSVAGNGQLDVDAAFLDLIGQTQLSGFADVDLRAASDIRLRGTLKDSLARDLIGGLDTPANVTLNASRIYPTTLSQYRVELTGADASLTFSSAGPSAGPSAGDVFSYGGSVDFVAVNILGSPHLFAPGGQIVMDASGSIDMSAGAQLSTRIDELVLFGQTQGGLDWIYPMPNGTVQLLESLERPRVALTAPSVRLAESAVVDASGGGDLQAYEFIAGPGGTRDFLASENVGSMFAILPTRNLPLAPFDAYESRNFLYGADSGVVLNGDASLPNGEFVVLPARYALLPGAYLVTPVGGLYDLVPGETRFDIDGTPVVAGRFTGFGTQSSADRWQGFRVQPGSVAGLYSEYDLTSANTFFPADDANAYAPRDSGNVLFEASGTIDLLGSVVSRGATAGRDGRLELAAPSIAIVAGSAVAAEGVTTLIDTQLDELVVGSLLIGGRSNGTTESGAISVEAQASTVSVGAGVSLAQREVVLAARDRIEVAAGATVAAVDAGSESTTTSLSTQRNDAILITSKDRILVERTDGASADEGTLALAAGSNVESVGTVAVQASGSAELSGEIRVEGGRLDLYSKRLVIENTSQGQPGVTSIGQQTLAAAQADELVLGVGEAIDVVDDLRLAARRVEIDAPLIRASGAESLTLAADTVALRNSSSVSPPAAPTTGNAKLHVDATTVEIGAGITTVDGFGDVRLTAADRVLAHGAGGLTAAGDVTFDTPLVVAESGDSALEVSSLGAVTLTNTLSSPTSAAESGELPGGSLEFSGQRVEVATTLRAASGSVSLVASGDDAKVGLRDSARVDVAGGVVQGVVESIATPGGQISIASEGDVIAEAGAILDVSGPQRAGALRVDARNGTATLASALIGGADGAIRVDAQTIGNVDGLVAAANGEHGFLGEQFYRQRSGDLVFGASDRIETHRFSAAADDGATTFDGELVLGERGRAQLYGSDAATFGGSVSGESVKLELEALGENARVTFAPQTGSTATGGIVARVLDAGDLAGRAAIADTTGLVERVELVSSYQVADGDFGSDDATLLRGILEGRAAMQDELRNNLALASGVDLVFGTRVSAPDDLAVSSALDLAGWRFGTQPGRFLMTAGGDVNVNASISDGFRPSNVFPADTLQDDPSWSLAFVSGSDASAADPFAVIGGVGSFTIGANTTVRTGSGDITVRAGEDFVLADPTSTLYTAGVRREMPGFDELFRFFILHDVQFPDRGGAIDIAAMGDVRGARSRQLISEYMVRFGGPFFDVTTMPTMFGVAFQRFDPTGQPLPAFEQNIGSFGGGDVRIRAGRDITDLSVVAPEMLNHTGDASGALVDGQPVVTYTDNSFERLSAAEVEIDAGRDLVGGVLYVGGGEGQASAGGNIRPGADGLGLVVAQSSSAVELWGGDSVLLETSFDPTLLTQSIGRLQSSSEITYYSSYTPDAKLNVGSLTGDVVFNVDTKRVAEGFDPPGDIARSETPFSVLPGTLRAVAASGDISILDDLTLFPTANGNLSLAAYGNVKGPEIPSVVLVSDADAALMPRPDAPQQNLDSVERRLQFAGATPGNLHAAVPVHTDDPEGSSVEAITGSVDAPGLTLSTAERLSVVARDEVNVFRVQSQHVRDSDTTHIQAGGDVRILASRDPETGQVIVNTRVIEVAGPGKLEVLAGRSIDLGTSDGIVTIGDLENPALADQGADVLILAGNAGEPNLRGFLATTLTTSPDALEVLEKVFGTAFDSAADALAYFDAATAADQREAAFTVLFSELEASGLAASQLIAQSAPAADIEVAYDRGRNATRSLFPDADDFQGDVGLFFSRIQTLDGGDIDVLVPGGELNVGLTVAFGTGKDASELGIVSQGRGDINIYTEGNVEVNRSRVFSLNGGDIDIWSNDGDIDAGRGAKTTLATPALSAVVGENDTILKVVPPEVSGSGIAADDGTSGQLPDILLSTPNGVVDAGDAGIRTPGRLFTAATDVIGRDNIEVGSFVGAPADTVVLSSDLAGVGDTAASAAESIAESAASQSSAANEQSESQSALAWLDVLLEGFGEEGDACDPKDPECKKRG